MIQEKLLLNTPVYTGFAVLDLSKVLMYQFHYQYIKHKYAERAQLLFTDTDSLCYQVNTEDFYHDMQPDLDLFDTADYPSYHTLHSTVNKKVIDKFKDETAGHPIREFVGLHPKMYRSVLKKNGREVEMETAKGIGKSVLEREIRHVDKRGCLFSKVSQMHSMIQIRSKNHQLQTVKLTKISSWPYDDKRFFLEDGFTTLAHGHYKTRV